MSKAPDSLLNAPEISIHLNSTNEKLTGWTGFQIVRSIDSACDAFSFSLPFDPTEKNRKRFLPYSPGVIKIYGDKEEFLTGYIEVVSVVSNGNNRTINLQGRSASGGLIDWSAGSVWDRGAQSFSDETVFEMEGMSFNNIVGKIANGHMVSADPDTAIINEISIEPGQSLYAVISKLAASNGYFGVPQPDGSLLYRNDLGKTVPVADISEEISPVISISTNHDVTKRFWKYQIIATSTGQTDVSAEIKDTILSPAIRGIKIIQPEQQSADYQKAAELARSRAMIDSYNVTVNLDGFAYNSGTKWKFWMPGDVVNIHAPGAFIFKKSKLIIKRVTFQLDENGGQKTALDLGFSESYSGEFPKGFPWEN